jgi:hypothetical protein
MHGTEKPTLPKASMRRMSRAVALALSCIVALEAGAALFFFWQRGGLIYVRRLPALPVPAPAPPIDLDAQRLHPYFGFAGPYDLRSGTAVTTNSLGFPQRERLSIPYTPSGREYVIAVFGGSVAARTAYGRQSGAPLVDFLRRMPAFADRPPVVIDMAQGSGKQPQQLIQLAYLIAAGQHIDLALNIDGFNEFALGWQNVHHGLDPILPALQIMQAIAASLSPATVRSEAFYRTVADMLDARKSLDAHARRADRTRIGLVFAWHTILRERSQAALARSTAAYERLIAADQWTGNRSRLGLDLPPLAADVDPFEHIFALWLRSSQQMRALAAANKIEYLHVVQPNQYYSRHAFSAGERKVALSLPPDHDYVTGIAKGYPLFAQRQAALAENGIVSAVGLFDDVHEEVYGDGCCHFTARGEVLFAEAVAREIVKAAFH